MTTASFQCCIYTIYIDCMLLHQYSGYRFKGNPEEDVLSVTDTALDTTGMVGFRFNASAVIEEYIVLFRAFLFQTFKSVTILKCFSCIDAER